MRSQAATYVDSSEVLRSIVSRAGRGSASQDDLADFQRALTDRYRPNFVDEPALTSSNFEMRQGDEEPLFAYHTRVVSLLRRAGGKDKPSGDEAPLSPSEKYILNDFIQRFITASARHNRSENFRTIDIGGSLALQGHIHGFDESVRVRISPLVDGLEGPLQFG
ncbi:hypothetical protein E4U17_000495 [Claviceps sp. LM77 group G4]|nr:hypothetical protein E4U17_000495 [Claviceps sp. LM77 group G4]KAG6052620.1 hypothetical protein E4U33_000447 [Claviceps sp. LM78 group G4]